MNKLGALCVTSNRGSVTKVGGEFYNSLVELVYVPATIADEATFLSLVNEAESWVGRKLMTSELQRIVSLVEER